MRDYEQRFGKTLDEDVKISVILALAPSQVQNFCRLNSHILKRNAPVRKMLFDYCRAQADTAAGDVAPRDLSMLSKSKKAKGRGQKGRRAERQMIQLSVNACMMQNCGLEPLITEEIVDVITGMTGPILLRMRPR